MEYVVEKKCDTGYNKKEKVKSSSDVYNLEIIQEIKNAIKEHLIFIGLNRGNEVRKIDILSIGNSGNSYADSKDIVRTAIVNGCDRVILAHNHPSNSLNPSKEDINMTNQMYKLLKSYNIELLDHLIVTEEGYLSLARKDLIKNSSVNECIKYLEEMNMKEEFEKLKLENEILKLKNKNLEEKLFGREDMNMKFESVIIMNPKLTDEQAKNEIEKYKEMLQGFSNKSVKTEDLGVKKLAYSIRGNDEGRYAILKFDGEPVNASELEKEYRNDDNVIKYMTIKTDELIDEYEEECCEEETEDLEM